LFFWNNDWHLRYPIHHFKHSWWWCYFFRWLNFQMYNIRLYSLWYGIWSYRKWFCSIHIWKIIEPLYVLSFTQNNFLHPFFYIDLNILSLLWLFYKVSIQHLLSHIFNKSILHFIINMWTLCNHMFSNSTKNIVLEKAWTNLAEST
jgi:hypothetical protein